MSIRVFCVHCGQRFSAWDDLVGKSVQCPKCERTMIVPATSAGGADCKPSRSPASGGGVNFADDFRIGSGDPAPGAGVAPPSKSPRAPEKPRREAKPTGADFETKAGRPTFPEKTTPPPKAPPVPPPPAPRPPLPTTTVAEDDSIPSSCPNCRAPMPANDDLCDQCGYHRILKKVLDTAGVYKPPKEVGFERWLQGTFTEGESLHSIGPWAIALGAALALFLGVLFFPWSCLLFVLLVVGGIVWWILRREAGMSGSGSGKMPLAPVLLILVRLSGWRAPRVPFAKLAVTDLSQSAIGDDELADVALEGIGALVLDGTEISDAGLPALEEAKHLQYLVLTRTRVTPQGVARLQKKLPETWIWS